jgi:acetylornithine deacetylase
MTYNSNSNSNSTASPDNTKKVPTQADFSHISAIEDVVELATAFINVESITNNEYPMLLALKSWLEPRGWTVDAQEIDDGEHPNRFNVIAYPVNTQMSDIQLLFNSHIDTVPPYYPAQFKKDENRLYGRGACDTKSLIAAQLIAATTLKDSAKFEGNIGLLYTVGEEVNHIGMKGTAKLFPALSGVRFLICGEPTESRTIVRQKGIYIATLTSKGKAAHSGYPEFGICALTPIINILHAIQNYSWPSDDILGNTTVNFWIIKGGIAANVVPEVAEAKIMFRCAVEPTIIEEQVLKIIEQFNGNLEDNKTAHVSYARFASFASPQTFEGVSKDFNPGVVSFGTDIPYFQGFKDEKCTAVLFGPGSITDAHSDHEFVDIDELIKAVDTYQDIAVRLITGNFGIGDDGKSNL